MLSHVLKCCRCVTSRLEKNLWELSKLSLLFFVLTTIRNGLRAGSSLTPPRSHAVVSSGTTSTKVLDNEQSWPGSYRDSSNLSFKL
ncbi:hypothetical protein L596_030696 [Steinernema carpocapsae]|uniref:Uncharacterized protein n=1 Tax=Steinernema carpocapsae TaxID=34508 RepID=A0A4U5LNH7_STECR|nr:hypothetical protein L596_030696 [Steinernema carpocapsae]